MAGVETVTEVSITRVVKATPVGLSR